MHEADDARDLWLKFLETFPNDTFQKPLTPKEMGILFEDWTVATSWNGAGQQAGTGLGMGNHFNHDQIDVTNIHQDKLERA